MWACARVLVELGETHPQNGAFSRENRGTSRKIGEQSRKKGETSRVWACVVVLLDQSTRAQSGVCLSCGGAPLAWLQREAERIAPNFAVRPKGETWGSLLFGLKTRSHVRGPVARGFDMLLVCILNMFKLESSSAKPRPVVPPLSFAPPCMLLVALQFWAIRLG